jgi:hypothetical protein
MKSPLQPWDDFVKHITRRYDRQKEFEAKYTNWEQYLADLETEESGKLSHETKDGEDQEFQKVMINSMFGYLQTVVRDLPVTFERGEQIRLLVNSIGSVVRAHSMSASSASTRRMTEQFIEISKLGDSKREQYIKRLAEQITTDERQKRKKEISEIRATHRQLVSHAKKFIGRQLSNDQREKYIAIATALKENKKKRKPRRESEVIAQLLKTNRTIFAASDDPHKLRKSYDLYIKRHPRFNSSVR